VSIISKPRILILETSGRSGQVALARGDQFLAVRKLDEARRHARDLAPALAELLIEQGWSARELDVVLVGRGPGSYTGLRVGIISAKMLAYATGCVMLAIDTFAAIARQALLEVDRLDVLADAQQGKIYVQSFQRHVGEWQPATALSIDRFENWLSRRSASAWVSGPGLTTYRARLPEGVPVVAAGDWEPRAESLLTIGLRRYRRGERDDPWSLEPIYLRPSAAEEQWKGHRRAP
jgi:tRNA threonylcarbamoyladenosine biosynthesis protein TsaB